MHRVAKKSECFAKGIVEILHLQLVGGMGEQLLPLVPHCCNCPHWLQLLSMSALVEFIGCQLSGPIICVCMNILACMKYKVSPVVMLPGHALCITQNDITHVHGIYRILLPWKWQYYVNNPDDAIPREISRNFQGNMDSLLAGYTANYTARCQSFSQPRSSGDIRRPKRSSLDATSSRHIASLCAGILSSCRLSHGKLVS